MKIVNGFKDFILRGNVIDLAVAVVIGAAFSGIINKVVEGLINPIIAAIGGAPNLDGAWVIPLRKIGADTIGIQVGTIVGAVLNFLIIAAATYFIIVLPVNRLLAMRKRGQVAEPKAPTEDVLLLTEIRDLLARQTGGTTPTLDTK
ncbi:large conductance mechanosensitive channel protein MscL [Kineococcus sp. NPDC059986]|jgi:large conductance mechanosensitive channel|uniref:large conductance mechanosensitive channel protein MscL n=1 Tax=Kineococcus sp. NPDC059986 TaxID=3155538 RepID=UPI00344EAFC7